MKYFGIFSVLIVVTIAIVWSARMLTGGLNTEGNNGTQNTSYQEAIDSARAISGSSSSNQVIPQ
jgi:hypothetical protein